MLLLTYRTPKVPNENCFLLDIFDELNLSFFPLVNNTLKILIALDFFAYVILSHLFNPFYRIVLIFIVLSDIMFQHQNKSVEDAGKYFGDHGYDRPRRGSGG